MASELHSSLSICLPGMSTLVSFQQLKLHMFKTLLSSFLPPKPVLVVQECVTAATGSTDFSEKSEIQNFGWLISCSVFVFLFV